MENNRKYPWTVMTSFLSITILLTGPLFAGAFGVSDYAEEKSIASGLKPSMCVVRDFGSTRSDIRVRFEDHNGEIKLAAISPTADLKPIYEINKTYECFYYYPDRTEYSNKIYFKWPTVEDNTVTKLCAGWITLYVGTLIAWMISSGCYFYERSL